ncbi:alcohol dehydrogenase catalytic domain-containing protein [Nonomuraea sp. NPDC049400]|uniref:alcohol dehydrogenase catalytic domain-containing protein n=1 Tax=Nonomuraea sp. NPDC049400 TaxID=3364352 RepID=UPI00378B03A8
MKALRWYGRGDVRLVDVDVPRPGPGEVLIAVTLCGICGSDVEEYHAGPIVVPVSPHPLTGRAAPLTLGHEVVGVVAEPGEGVTLAPGTPVVPDVVLGCGRCWWCARGEYPLCERGAALGLQDDGGLAEYLVAPAGRCAPLPDGMPADVAVFAEPAAVAVRALDKAGDVSGAVVAVVGAGAIGLLVAQVARCRRAAAIVAVDPDPGRRSLAGSCGLVAAAPGDAADAAVRELTGGRGADVVVESAGTAAAVAGALSLCRRGGTAVLLGVTPEPAVLPTLDVVLGEKHVVGSASHRWDTDVRGAVALLHSGHVRVDQLPVQTVPLPDAVRRGLADPPRHLLKTIVDVASVRD